MKFVAFVLSILMTAFAIGVVWRISVVLSLPIMDYPFGEVFYNSLWAVGLIYGFIWFVTRLFSRRADW